MPAFRLRRFTAAFFWGVAVVSAPVLSGCPLLYKTEIRQGNTDILQKLPELREGMSKEEVRAVMGPPQAQHAFRGARQWIYISYLRAAGSGDKPPGVAVELEFDEDGVLRAIGQPRELPSPF